MSPTPTESEDLPRDIWQVNQRLQFDEVLEPDDPRWVDTTKARGEFSLSPLYRNLGIDSKSWQLKAPPSRAYVLLCGHRGCGKSTELRRIYRRLDQHDLFLVIFLDATRALDPNNLQYQDVLLALAEALLRRLAQEGARVDDVHLSRLRSWFDERIEQHEATRQFAADAKSGAKGEVGIPFLSKLFAEITTAFKVSSTYKDELRRVVRNHFSEFAEAFNHLISAAQQACERQGLSGRLLFMVDGTDRLSGENAHSFFVKDVHQLQLIESLFIYSTPIHLLHGGVSLKENFNDTFKLPMIKLFTRDGRAHAPGWEAMREILFRRAPRELFDSDETADFLIEHCGGHPRDLLRLLQYAFQHTRSELFDRPAAERAVQTLATDYRQFLEAEDYTLLRRVDQDPVFESNSERARHLLYNLALLEYNAYWWRSHPAVRTLDAYQRTERG